MDHWKAPKFPMGKLFICPNWILNDIWYFVFTFCHSRAVIGKFRLISIECQREESHEMENKEKWDCASIFNWLKFNFAIFKSHLTWPFFCFYAKITTDVFNPFSFTVMAICCTTSKNVFLCYFSVIAQHKTVCCREVCREESIKRISRMWLQLACRNFYNRHCPSHSMKKRVEWRGAHVWIVQSSYKHRWNGKSDGINSINHD